MNTPIPVIVDGQAGIFAHSKARVATLNAKAKERLCLMDARIRTLMAEPEEGAATAEYAVVLVAATGFAAVLVAILKSDAIKTLLTNIIKQALKAGDSHEDHDMPVAARQTAARPMHGIGHRRIRNRIAQHYRHRRADIGNRTCGHRFHGLSKCRGSGCTRVCGYR